MAVSRTRPVRSPEAAADPPGRPTVLERAAWAAWVLLLLTVPFTSHPWVARWNGGSLVSPLSGIPLLILGGIWLAPVVFRRRLPPLAGPLLAFVWIAALGVLLVPFQGLIPWKDQEPVARALRAAVTLVIGVSFYLTAATLPRGSARIRASLAWLSLGAVLTLAWASVQASIISQAHNPVPLRMQDFHHWFVIQDMFRGRVSGFAYEPSWLADQLVLLYFPIWLGLILQRETAFPWRFRGLTIELLLLIWGIVILFLTFSRAGYVAGIVLLASLLLPRAWSWSGKAAAQLARARAGLESPIRGLILLVTTIGFLTLALLGVIGAAQINPRIARVFDLNWVSIARSQRFPWTYALANRLEYGERLVYWVSAYGNFNRSPLLGVGLGASGFAFGDNIPGYGYYLPEILDNLDPGSDTFPNPKSLWIRLLAETGAIGFAAFAVWLVALALAARAVRKGAGPILQSVGTAFALSLLVLVFEGFSLDSFALPQMWIIPGLLTAAATAEGARAAPPRA